MIAATDYMRTVGDLIRNWVPRRYIVLGTDGFGRSDTRAALRSFFEVDRCHVAVAALKALADEGVLSAQLVKQAIEKYGIDPDRRIPGIVDLALSRGLELSQRCVLRLRKAKAATTASPGTHEPTVEGSGIGPTVVDQLPRRVSPSFCIAWPLNSITLVGAANWPDDRERSERHGVALGIGFDPGTGIQPDGDVGQRGIDLWTDADGVEASRRRRNHKLIKRQPEVFFERRAD